MTLEKVAEAIYAHYGWATEYSQTDESVKETCRGMARAALMAMRASMPTTGAYQEVVRGEMMTAMIDAILAEGGE